MGELCRVSRDITYPILIIEDVASPGLVHEVVLEDFLTRNRLRLRLEGVTLLLLGQR